MIVVLIVSVGGVVSTVAVTADVVVVLPAVSVALAVKLWLPQEAQPSCNSSCPS